MRRRSPAIAALLCGFLTAATLAPPVRAQSAEDKTAAEALFEEGKKLLADKRFADACARFERSQRLDPGVGTLLFLADCYETMGRTASAWSTFREAASAAKTAGQADRERLARERAQKLDGTLYQLTISAPSAEKTPGLTIKRNDVPVKPDVWSMAVPVDPGNYKLTATAPGKKPWTTTVEVPTGAGQRTVEIPTLEDDPAAKSASSATIAPPDVGPPPHDPVSALPPPPTSPLRTAGIAVGSIGLVALVAGGALGAAAMSQFGDVKSACPDVKCGDPAIVDKSKQVGLFADVSTVGLVAGGVLAAGGLVMFLVAPSNKTPEKSPAKAWISPVAGTGTFGLRAGANW